MVIVIPYDLAMNNFSIIFLNSTHSCLTNLSSAHLVIQHPDIFCSAGYQILFQYRYGMQTCYVEWEYHIST
ncbi:hypothetical protein ACJIZ3_019951 [Penstemon smallii]|uniref:Uncharacterized protein n=1 Tax=Penstemon smallii TaxID=265156 RepID=A0ABD3T2L8_9LAMI